MHAHLAPILHVPRHQHPVRHRHKYMPTRELRDVTSLVEAHGCDLGMVEELDHFGSGAGGWGGGKPVTFGRNGPQDGAAEGGTGGGRYRGLVKGLKVYVSGAIEEVDMCIVPDGVRLPEPVEPLAYLRSP